LIIKPQNNSGKHSAFFSLVDIISQPVPTRRGVRFIHSSFSALSNIHGRRSRCGFSGVQSNKYFVNKLPAAE